MNSYVFLSLAILAEVAGTAALQKSEHFTKTGPTAVMVICYVFTFYFLSQALKTIPLGIAYGIWGSLGIILTAAIGFLVFKQRLDLPAVVGIGLMVTGVAVIQIFSKTTTY